MENIIDDKIEFIYKEQFLIMYIKDYHMETNKDLRIELYDKIKVLMKELYNIE